MKYLQIDWHRVIEAVLNGKETPEAITVNNKAYILALETILPTWNNRYYYTAIPFLAQNIFACIKS